MRYSIRTVTPVGEIPLPFSLEEAKAHLRVEAGDDSEDALITAYLLSAVDHVEKYTSQILTPRVLEWVADSFPCLPELIVLPREPVTGIVSIAYTDGDGAPVTMEAGDYRWSEAAADAVMPAFRAAWPRAAAERGSVRVRFNAGYEEGLAPASLLGAVKLMLGHLYTNRESVIVGAAANELPNGVQALCAPYRRIVI